MASSRRFILRVRRRIYTRDYRYAHSISDSYDGSAKGSVKFNFNGVTSGRLGEQLRRASRLFVGGAANFPQVFSERAHDTRGKRIKRHWKIPSSRCVTAWTTDGGEILFSNFKRTSPVRDWLCFIFIHEILQRTDKRASLEILTEDVYALVSSMTKLERFERTYKNNFPRYCIGEVRK